MRFKVLSLNRRDLTPVTTRDPLGAVVISWLFEQRE